MSGSYTYLVEPMLLVPNKPVVYAGYVFIGRTVEGLIGQLSSSINDFKAGEFFFIHSRIFRFTTDFFHL
ncbi:hypothetical protein N879_04370 [Alcaligenes sp. EGD-AK7]|nr:hypothetical protein N879_04370 [Alcaligenes sp. EGD-AK7]